MAENAPRHHVHPRASQDVARRLLGTGLFARADDGGIKSLTGVTPDDVMAQMRDDPGSQHLFVPSPAPTRPVAKPDPKTMDAKTRLAFANGDNLKPVFRKGTL
ncbi:MAG: hypothetical protein ACXWKX_04200 [Caulobacteraceae bacterium]